MKKTLSLLCSLVAIILCISVLPNATAKAETEDYLQASYYVEISESETALPVPNVPNGWAYTITLKKGTEVLGEKIIKYAFTETGEYTLVYKLHKNGSLTDVTYETATLIVSDTTSPVITTDGYPHHFHDLAVFRFNLALFQLFELVLLFGNFGFDLFDLGLDLCAFAYCHEILLLR